MHEFDQNANPTHMVALRCSSEDEASAQSMVEVDHGNTAEEIVRIARSHNIPLKQDPDLAAALSPLDAGSSIPPELYRAAAEVIAFVCRLNGKIR